MFERNFQKIFFGNYWRNLKRCDGICSFALTSLFQESNDQLNSTADLFEHVKSDTEKFDAQTADAADKDEAVQQRLDKLQIDEEMEDDQDVVMDRTDESDEVSTETVG